MRVLGSNVAFATWLLISAFLFSRTPASLAITVVAAVAVATLSALSVGRPGLRGLIAVVAVALAVVALLLPDISAIARLNDALVAAILFALALVSPLHHTEPVTTGPAHG